MLAHSVVSRCRMAFAYSTLAALAGCTTVVGPPGKSQARVSYEDNLCARQAAIYGLANHEAAYAGCMVGFGNTVRLADGRVLGPTRNTYSHDAEPSPSTLGNQESTPQIALQTPHADFPSQAAIPGQEAIRHLLHQCVQMMFHAQEHGPQEVMSIAREIDTFPEVGPAMPFVGEQKGAYAECLSNARGFIGGYFFDNGAGQDYAEAAKWLTKAVNTPIVYEIVLGGISHYPSSINSWRKELGFLYAYGLGVPRDRARARQIWASTDGIDEYPPMTGSNLVRLIDRDALPRTVDSFRSLQTAVAEFAEKEAQEHARRQALAEQQRDREEAADLERRRTAWAALPQADRHHQCVSQCEPRVAACHSHNTDNAWGSMWSGGASLGSLIRADMTSTAHGFTIPAWTRARRDHRSGHDASPQAAQATV